MSERCLSSKVLHRFSRACIWLALLTAACGLGAPPLDIKDGGLLSGEPCPAPCFWAIYPGMTTTDQAVEILLGHGARGRPQEGRFIVYGNSLTLHYDEHRIVDRLSFVPSPPIAVDAAIAKHGVPDAVGVRWDPTSVPEHPMFDLGLYYDGSHMWLSLERQEAWPQPEIAQDTRIMGVVYYSESVYSKARHADEPLVVWKGYGSYAEPGMYP